MTSQSFLNELICSGFSCEVYHECVQVCYPQRQSLPVRHKDIRLLGPEDAEYVITHYHMGEPEYIRERIQSRAMYGAFVEGELKGFVGSHDEGSMGMLFVEDSCRERGIGASLEAYNINRICERGFNTLCAYHCGKRCFSQPAAEAGIVCFFRDYLVAWKKGIEKNLAFTVLIW